MCSSDLQKGARSVDMYLKQTAIANPHLTLHFTDPSGEEITYKRSTKEKPKETKEIKPHPHGIELGILIAMLKETNCRSLSGFLQEEFSRVGATVGEDGVGDNGAQVHELHRGRRRAPHAADQAYQRRL